MSGDANGAWQELYSHEHQLPYYYNKETKETVWESPFATANEAVPDEEDFDEEEEDVVSRPMFMLQADDMTEEEYEALEKQQREAAEAKKRAKARAEKQKQWEEEEQQRLEQEELERKAEAKRILEQRKTAKAALVGITEGISEMTEEEIDEIVALNKIRNSVAGKPVIDTNAFRLIFYLNGMSYAEQAKLRALSTAEIAGKLDVAPSHVVLQEATARSASSETVSTDNNSETTDQNAKESDAESTAPAKIGHSRTVSFPDRVLKMAEIKEQLTASSDQETLYRDNKAMRKRIQEMQQQVEAAEKTRRQVQTKYDFLSVELPKKNERIQKLERQLKALKSASSSSPSINEPIAEESQSDERVRELTEQVLEHKETIAEQAKTIEALEARLIEAGLAVHQRGRSATGIQPEAAHSDPLQRYAAEQGSSEDDEDNEAAP